MIEGRSIIVQCNSISKQEYIDTIIKLNPMYQRVYLYVSEYPTQDPSPIQSYINLWKKEAKLKKYQQACLVVDLDHPDFTDKDWRALLDNCKLFKLEVHILTTIPYTLPPYIEKKWCGIVREAALTNIEISLSNKFSDQLTNDQ